MKKVIIDGVEYIPVTPEVKEEPRWEHDRCHFVLTGGEKHTFDTMSRAMDYAKKHGLTYQCKFNEPKDMKEEKRLEGWVDKKHFINSECTWINSTRVKTAEQTTKFVAIKENEIIVSEDDAYIALSVFMCDPFIKKNNDYETYLETLGFKKDGV